MMTPRLPSDADLLRAIYRRLDKRALKSDYPDLTDEELIGFFKRLCALLETPAPAPAEPAPTHVVAPAGVGRAILHTDGGSRGNPGLAGYGAVLLDESGRIVAETGKCIGTATSNEAEYNGLIAGLQMALDHDVKDILIRADSLLLVQQLKGVFKVRSPKLMGLFLNARRSLDQFKTWKIEHIPREMNSHADYLANKAMDEGVKS